MCVHWFSSWLWSYINYFTPLIKEFRSFYVRIRTKKSNIMEIIEVKRERDAYSIEWWSWRNFNEKLCLDLAWKWNFWCFFQSHHRKTKQKHLFSVLRGMSKVMWRKTEKVNKNIKKLKYTDWHKIMSYSFTSLFIHLLLSPLKCDMLC